MTDTVYRLHRGERRGRVCGDRHRERVEDKILLIDTVVRGSLNDLLGDRDTLVSCIRNTILIKSQRNDESAILRNEREDHTHDFFLTVDGVDHRLTVIRTKTGFHRHRVRGIELQRKIRNSLKFSYCTKQESRLIDLRKTDVDVEELYSRVLLF